MKVKVIKRRLTAWVMAMIVACCMILSPSTAMYIQASATTPADIGQSSNAVTATITKIKDIGAYHEYVLKVDNKLNESISDWVVDVSLSGVTKVENWSSWAKVKGAFNDSHLYLAPSNGSQGIISAYGSYGATSDGDYKFGYSGANAIDNAKVTVYYKTGNSYTGAFDAVMGSTSSGGTSGGSTGSGTDLNLDITYNYAKLLQYSLYFYDANMCGELEGKCSLNWRKNCHLCDKQVTYNGQTIDVSGGFHDAGDHDKFGLPQGYSAAVLGMGYYEYKDAYVKTGQQEHFKKILDYFCDYFARCTVYDNDNNAVAFCYQVGDGASHNQWVSPETENIERPAYFADASTPATDQVSEAVAALAIHYINFGNKEYLECAEKLFAMAKKNGKAAQNSQGGGFYNSSNWEDDYCLAAAWLYKATNNSDYKSEYNKYSGNLKLYSWPSWDDVSAYAQAYGAGDVGGLNTNASSIKNGCVNVDNGFAWLCQWGSNRYSCNTQLEGLIYDKYNNSDSYTSWSESQIKFMLGNNTQKQCYVVGYNENATKYPHHRAASGYNGFPDAGNQYTQQKYSLIGALAGGIESSDGTYHDSSADYYCNEVAIDYNAAFTGVAAALYLKNQNDGQQKIVTKNDADAPVEIKTFYGTDTPSGEDVTTQESTTEKVTTTEAQTTQEATTEKVTTEAQTTQEVTEKEPTTEKVTTREPQTTQEVTEKEPTTEKVTTREPQTTQEITEKEPTTEKVTTREPQTTQEVTEQRTTEKVTTREPQTTQEVTEQRTTEKVTTREPQTTQEVTEQQTTEKVTTREPQTTQEVTEQQTTEKVTTREPQTTQAPTQQATTTQQVTEEPDDTTQGPTINIIDFSFEKQRMQLEKGQKEQIQYSLLPNISGANVISWESSDETVAKVDETGKVEAVGSGEATITAKAGDKVVSCKVEVTNYVKEILLNETNVTVEPGAILELVPSISPIDADDKDNLEWNSSDVTAAVVDESGIVTALSEGTTLISVTIGKVTAYCIVNVEEEKEEQEPSEEKTITYLMDDEEEQVKIQAGSVIVLKDIEKTGYQVSWFDVMAQKTYQPKELYKVTEDTVLVAQFTPILVEEIAIAGAVETMQIGDAIMLTASVLPKNALQKEVEWISDNKAVADFDENGYLYAKAAGTVRITAYALDGSGVEESIVLVVESENETTEYNPDNMTTEEKEDATSEESEATTEDKEDVTSEEPKATTEAEEDVTSEEPKATTEDKEDATSEEPKATTEDKEDVTTEEPKATTEDKEDVTSEEPEATTEDKEDVTTEEPKATTEDKEDVTTEEPKVTTEDKEDATSEEPKATTNANASQNQSGQNTTGATPSSSTATNAVQTIPSQITAINVAASLKNIVKVAIGTNYKLAKNVSMQLQVTTLPENADKETITFTTSDASIVNVSQNGLITTGNKAGKALIVAKTQSGVAKYFWIQVMNGKVTSVKIKATKNVVKKNKKLKLKAVVKTTKKASKKIVWQSSNTKIAKVSSNGTVTALKKGKVKISAIAADGTGKKATITLRVK